MGDNEWTTVTHTKKTPAKTGGDGGSKGGKTGKASSKKSKKSKSKKAKQQEPTADPKVQMELAAAQVKGQKTSGKGNGPAAEEAPAPAKKTSSKAKKGGKTAARRTPMEEAVKAVDAATMAVYAQEAKVRFPKHPAVQLQALMDAYMSAVSDGDSDLTSADPIQHLSPSAAAVFLDAAEEVDTPALRQTLTATMKQLIEAAERGDSVLGYQLVVQLFILFEVERRKQCGLLYGAYKSVADAYKKQFPKKNVVLPLLWIFNQVATSLSATYIMVWKSLMLPLLFDDEASAEVKSACVAGMQRLLPDDHSKCMTRIKVLVRRSVPGIELTPRHMIMLIMTAYSRRKQFAEQHKLHRHHRYLRNLALGSHDACRALVEKLPAAAATVPKTDTAVQHELLDLAAIAFSMQPTYCVQPLISGLNNPAGCTVFLQHLLTTRRVPDERARLDFVAAIESLRAAAERQAGEKYDTVAHLCKQVQLMIEDRKKQEEAAGSYDVLSWVLLFLMAACFSLLLLLASYTYCETYPSREQRPLPLHEYCVRMEQWGVLQQVQRGLDVTLPLGQKLEPYALQALEQAKEKWPLVKGHVQTAYNTAEPHIKAAIARAKPVVMNGLAAAGQVFFPAMKQATQAIADLMQQYAHTLAQAKQ